MASHTPTRILNAARSCYQREGILKVSMEDIATEAGISRRTLYRHFTSRHEVLSHVIQEAAKEFLEGMSLTLKNTQHFDDFFIEALIYSIEKGPEVSSHTFLFGQGILPIMNDLYLSSKEFRTLSINFWEKEFLKRNGQNPAYLDMAIISELFNRTTLSYLATPSPLFKTRSDLYRLFSASMKPVLNSTMAPLAIEGNT